MKSARRGWWSYAKHLIREYPALKNEYDALHIPHITADPTHIRVNSGNTSRSTESMAMRQLPPAKQAAYDAVTKAIEQTKLLKTGAERLQLIDKVYWKQSHSIEGASFAIGYSEATGKRFHGDFVRLVGFNRGLEDWQ